MENKLPQSALKKLVQGMQQLSQTEMEELFRIIERAKCPYTCNNHGVFVNLSWISEEVIHDIEKFIAYCDQCRDELDKYDHIQSTYTSMMHTDADNIEGAGTGGEVHVSKSKVDDELKNRKPRSSNYSLKFYLLKKRLQKNTNLCNEWEDALTPECYEN